MERLNLECLRCGETREVEHEPRRRVEAGECARCGYLGWALTTDLTELVRRLLRERPLGRRGLRAV
jgi:hypothetical protein